MQALLNALKPSLEGMKSVDAVDSQPEEMQQMQQPVPHKDPSEPQRNPEIDSLLALLAPSPKGGAIPTSKPAKPAEQARSRDVDNARRRDSRSPIVAAPAQRKASSHSTDKRTNAATTKPNTASTSTPQISSQEATELRTMTFPQAMLVLPTLPSQTVDSVKAIHAQQHRIEKALHAEWSVMHSKYASGRRDLEHKMALARIDLSKDMQRLEDEFRRREDAFKAKAQIRWGDVVSMFRFLIQHI